jgi:ATP-dependent DNA helicase RecG
MNQTASPNALSLPLIQSHLRDVGSELSNSARDMDFGLLCRRLGIVDGPMEHVLPRNVGLMFFHHQPEQFFPQTQIDVVQFPDGLGGNTIIEKTFKGPLSQQLRNALSYISNSILEETIVKRENRAEADRFFNYPYAAIEEVLVNAAYHRSYEIREPIEVRVLPDHITITSYPGPDRSISLSELSAGRLVARRYRNRRIGEFLKELRLTEGRGTGIPKVMRAMANNGSPLPRFDTDEERTFFTAVLPVHELVTKKNIQVTPQVTIQVSPQVADGYILLIGSERMRVLLDYCKSPRDRAGIQARLGLRSIQNLRQRYIIPLTKAGLLAMTDPEHPNSPAQKYRTTPLGSAILDQHQETTR